MNDWPFDEPKNVVSFTSRQVIREEQPILWVSHDADDGAWQFHTGGIVSVADAMIVLLQNIVNRDPTVSELADLPLGWVAERGAVGAPWRRSKHEEIE